MQITETYVHKVAKMAWRRFSCKEGIQQLPDRGTKSFVVSSRGTEDEVCSSTVPACKITTVISSTIQDYLMEMKCVGNGMEMSWEL